MTTKSLKFEKVSTFQLPGGIAVKFSSIIKHLIGTGLIKENLHSKVVFHVLSQSLSFQLVPLQCALPWWKLPSTLNCLLLLIDVWTSSIISHLVYAFNQWMNSTSALFKEFSAPNQAKDVCFHKPCIFRNSHTSLLGLLDFSFKHKRLTHKKEKKHSTTLISLLLRSPLSSGFNLTHFLFQSNRYFSLCVLFLLLPSHDLSLALTNVGHSIISEPLLGYYLSLVFL